MKSEYTLVHDCEGIYENILYTTHGMRIPILQQNGKKRELQNLQIIETYRKKYHSVLPIFIGFGAGFAIEQYSHSKQECIVIDLENLYELTKEELTILPEYIHLITGSTIEENLHQLDVLVQKHKYPLCIPILHPFIKKHHSELYAPYIQRANELARYNPFGKTRYQHFKQGKTVILCLWIPSSITQELTYALREQGVEFHEVILPRYTTSLHVITQIIEKIQRFHPDFILTVNHTGFDTSNLIAEIISLFQIPIASWFMDNPELDIERAPVLLNSNLAVFTYDKNNLSYLNSIGITNAYYLPLGTNIQNFLPYTPHSLHNIEKAPLGFLGDSREKSIRKQREKSFGAQLDYYSVALAHSFLYSDSYTVQEEITQNYPFLLTPFLALTTEDRRNYIQLIFDLATQKKRINAIINASILPSIILGDSYWPCFLPEKADRYIGTEIEYKDARYFYSHVDIILNSTCTQMKGAVNQRLFDCPIAGALVITDYAHQVEEIFDIGTEVVCYSTVDEIHDYIRYYYTHPHHRMEIINNAQRRIYHQHTWGHRLQTIITIMTQLYG